MGTASGVISTLQATLACNGSCSCCQTLEERINSLSAEVATLRNRQQTFEQFVYERINGLNNAIGEIAASIDRKLDAFQQFVITSLAALRDFILNQLSGGNSGLEQRINALEDRLNRLAFRAQDFAAQIADLAARIEALGARIGSIEAWKATIDSQISSLSSQIRAFENRIGALERQLDNLRASIGALETLINTKITELRSLIESLAREIATQIDSIRRYIDEKISEISRVITEIIARLDRLSEYLRDLIAREIARLTSFIYDQIRALTDLIYSLLGRNNSERDLSSLERRIEILESIVDRINRTIINLSDLIEQLRRRLAALEALVNSLLRRITNPTNDNPDMSEIRGLFSQILAAINNLRLPPTQPTQPSQCAGVLAAVSNNIQLTSRVLSKLDINISGNTIQSDCGNGSQNYTRSYSGNGLLGLSDQITSLNLALSNKLCNLPNAAVPTTQAAQTKTINRIYRILGGDTWFDSADQISILHDPEVQLRASGTRQFNAEGKTSNNTQSVSLLDWMQNMLAPQYYRAGYQELPGEVPETLLSIGSDTDRKILNALDLQQWQIEQLDALIGQFPLEIEIKDTDPLTAGDQTKKLELANLSEVMAELVGLSFLQSQNSDILINYINRLGVETIATKNAAIIAQDYAKANASYLGYNANPVKREIPYALNPAGDSLETILTDTKGELIGWANTDKNSVADYLKRIFFTVGILKESNFIRPKNVDRLLDSLNMVRSQDNQEASTKFTNDILTLNDLGSTFNLAVKKDKSLPQPVIKIKNLS